MQADSYGSFAVFGAGLIGAPIARALCARGAAVLVVVRPGQQIPTLPGAAVREIVCTDFAAIAQALVEHAVQVVISTMSAADASTQNALASAAQMAGVALFVPSEFGVVTDGMADYAGTIGKYLALHLNTIGLPFARFYVGFFMETIPAMTGLSVNGKINVAGYGNMSCSFTASDDLAGFLAHVLTTLSPQELFNRTFRLQGDRSTISGLAVLFGTEVEYVEKIPGQMGEVWTRLQMAAECGAASTGWNRQLRAEGEECAGCTNHLWEGHEWTTIKAFYKL
ncbi:hypothetical protein GGX14DRAFT_617849, partial [Mycena pura]